MESTASVDEDSEEEGSRTSKDVDTILLFTNPVHNTLSTLGKMIKIIISYQLCVFWNFDKYFVKTPYYVI